MAILVGILTVLLPPVLIFFIRLIDPKEFDDHFIFDKDPGNVIIGSIIPIISILMLLLTIIILSESMLKKIKLDMLYTLIYFLPILSLGLLWLM